MKKIISVIFLALVLAAPAGFAQEWRVEPGVRIGYEVDDNATLNFVTILEPDISGTLLDGSVRFGYLSPTTTFYATPRVLRRDYGEEEFDATEEFFNFRFTRDGKSSRFAIRGNYASELTRTAERIDADLDIEDPDEIPDDNTSLVGIRDKRNRLSIVPSYNYDISDQSTIGFDLNYTDVTYDEKLAGILNDYRNTRANVVFRRKWSERNRALLGATYRTFESEGSDEVSGYGVSGGIERLLSEKTTLRFVVGIESTDTIDGENEVDPVGEITLIRNLQTINLLAQYRRVVSGGGTGSLTTRDTININFRRDLNDRVTAGLGVRAYSTKSRLTTGGIGDERDYVQLRAQFIWNVSPTFSLEANYRYTVLDRVAIGESANSNNITVWMNWRPIGYSSTR